MPTSSTIQAPSSTASTPSGLRGTSPTPHSSSPSGLRETSIHGQVEFFGNLDDHEQSTPARVEDLADADADIDRQNIEDDDEAPPLPPCDEEGADEQGVLPELTYEQREKLRKAAYNRTEKISRQELNNALGMTTKALTQELRSQFCQAMMKKGAPLHTGKRFKDYNYETVMRSALRVTAAVMSKTYGKAWTVARCEKLARMICLDKKWNIGVKSKQAAKRAQDREEKRTERLRAEKDRMAGIDNDEDLEESVSITESDVDEPGNGTSISHLSLKYLQASC